MNTDEMEDNFNLQSAVDDALNQISANGPNAELIFVDVKQSPDACKVSGTYKKAGTPWAVTYKIKCGNKETDYKLEAANEEELKAKLLKQVNEAVGKL
jgi:hypothetical protein